MIQFICNQCGALTVTSNHTSMCDGFKPSNHEERLSTSTDTANGEINFYPPPNMSQDTPAICHSKTSDQVIKTIIFGIHDHLPPFYSTKLPTEVSTKFLIQLHAEMFGNNSKILSYYNKFHSLKDFWFFILSESDLNAFNFSPAKQEFYLYISSHRERNPYKKLADLKTKYPKEDLSDIENQLKQQEEKIIKYILNQE